MRRLAAPVKRQGRLAVLGYLYRTAAAVAVLALLPASFSASAGVDIDCTSGRCIGSWVEAQHVDRNTGGARFRPAPVDRALKHTGSGTRSTSKNSRSRDSRTKNSSSRNRRSGQESRKAIRVRGGRVHQCTINSAGVEVCPGGVTPGK